ncbi:MAG: tetratricopeptide repeat protein [Patescibacteria group bacterium]
MFELLPQFIIIVAITTVIVIVLRRMPNVTVKEEVEDLEAKNLSARQKLQNFFAGLSDLLKRLWRFFANFVAEAKDHTVRANYMERFSKVMRLRGLRSRFAGFPPRRGIDWPAPRTNLMSESNPETIEQALIKAIEKNPGSQEAYEGLGKFYLEQKKFREAKEVYEYLVNVHSPKDGYFSALGLIYFNLGNYDDAIVAYSKAIQLRPELPTRLVNLSLCYEAKGRIREAIDSVEKALEINPDSAQYMLLLADFLIKDKKPVDVREVLLKVLELEPSNQEAAQKLLEIGE